MVEANDKIDTTNSSAAGQSENQPLRDANERSSAATDNSHSYKKTLICFFLLCFLILAIFRRTIISKIAVLIVDWIEPM